MFNTHTHLLPALTIAALALPGLASASSLPGADIDNTELGVGFGAGLSLGLDVPINSAGGTLGFSAATAFPYGPYYYDDGYAYLPRFSVRYLHPLIDDSSGFQLDLLVGVIGSADWSRNYSGWPVPLGPQVGVAMALPFTDRLTGRLNLALGYGPYWWGGRQFGSPASGIELAYKFSEAVEGTIGVNGYGDLLGLNIVF